MNKYDCCAVWQSGKTDIMREALIGQNVNARMHTMSFTLSGSSLLSRFIRIENKLKERMVNNIGKEIRYH